ncbi:MAG: insulinase family protein [Gemmatimonadota bacterium]|nr:insulinase family protein [Gemmatimonadota bacterium]
MLLKVMLSFVLCYVIGVLTAFAEIPNHHIFYRQDKRAPLTKIEIVFLGAGSGAEQPSQIGLAGTGSKLIWESGKKHGHMDQLETLGTRLNTSTRSLYYTISFYGLSEHCAKSIKIVRDLIYNLELSESDLEQVKKLMVADIHNYLRRRTYSLMKNFALSQTKGIKKSGSLKTLKNLSIEDIKQYYDQLLKTDVVFFKVISNRDSTEIAKWLRPITEKRETGGFVHSLKFPTTAYSVGPSAFVFNSNRKNISCYWLIPCGSVGEEDYIPSMISRAFGQTDARGLIYKYFREELGLVYSTGSNYQAEENVRFLEIYADPQRHNSEELITKMSDLIRGLPDNPRFWAAIKALRESRNIAYAHAHEQLTLQRKLDNEVYRAIYNPPRRKGGSKSVTDAEVRAFLEKFFVPKNMIMIFVGPKDHIIDILKKHLPEVDIHVHDVKELIE